MRWFKGISPSLQLYHTMEAVDNVPGVPRTFDCPTFTVDYKRRANVEGQVLAISILATKNPETFALSLLRSRTNNEFRRIGLLRVPQSWFNGGFGMDVFIV